MTLTISQIRRDGGTQSRASINEATVAEYAEAMTDEATVFPPVIVYFDGREYWLADGFHRLEAWERLGREEIPAEVRQGDRRRAILHSVAANSAHGLRRSNEDKRRAVLTLLEYAEWSAWSDREIARRCGVSHPFVAGIRADLSGSGFQIAAARTVERNGTTYQRNIANICGNSDQGVVPKPEKITSLPQGNKAAEVVPAREGNRPAADDQEGVESEVDTPAEDPETVKARKALAGLTRETLEDDLTGLRAENAEIKAKAKSLQAEVAARQEQVKDFSGDLAEVIRRQAAIIKHKDSEIQCVGDTLAAEKRKTYAMAKRVAELEAMGIVL